MEAILQLLLKKIYLPAWVYNVLSLLLILFSYGAEQLGVLVGIPATTIAVIVAVIQSILNQKPLNDGKTISTQTIPIPKEIPTPSATTPYNYSTDGELSVSANDIEASAAAKDNLLGRKDRE